LACFLGYIIDVVTGARVSEKSKLNGYREMTMAQHGAETFGRLLGPKKPNIENIHTQSNNITLRRNKKPMRSERQGVKTTTTKKTIS
jgi:hypothetical protein